MLPTLMVGDYILVSKSAYGLRVPESDIRFAGRGAPQHGDVAVFRYPEKPELRYVKRIVGLPGDTVAYRDKRLSINGRETQRAADGSEQSPEAGEHPMLRYKETLGQHTYTILVNPDAPPVQVATVRQFPSRER